MNDGFVHIRTSMLNVLIIVVLIYNRLERFTRQDQHHLNSLISDNGTNSFSLGEDIAHRDDKKPQVFVDEDGIPHFEHGMGEGNHEHGIPDISREDEDGIPGLSRIMDNSPESDSDVDVI